MLIKKPVRAVHDLVRLLGGSILDRWPVPWVLERPLADYGFISKMVHEFRIGELEGDFLELGSWLGFGTVKLAGLAKRHGKVVHTADWFSVDFGRPSTVLSASAKRYTKLYRGMTQRDVFNRSTQGYSNIKVHVGNVEDLCFPTHQRFVCSVIDSGHTEKTVKACLNLTWAHTTPGGLIFLDDYGNPDYPDVKPVTDEFIQDNRHAIGLTRHKDRRRMVVIVKKDLEPV